MTRNEIETAILNGTKVEAGEGDDHDTGRVLEILDNGLALVAWDSGVRTPCPIGDLNAA